MLESLKVISGVVGSVAALVAAVAVLLRLRAERTTGWVSGDRGAGWFDGLTRPVPVLVGAGILAAVSGLLLSTAGEEDPGADDTSLRLLHQLVDTNAQGCREDTPIDGATTALTCSFTGGPMRSLRIALFPSVQALEQAEQAKLESAGPREGSCGSLRTAWESWRHGVLLCDYGEQGFPAHLEWSRRDSRVLIRAQARDAASARVVYDWWLKESNGAPANNRQPYPDRGEGALLRQAGLERGDCERVAGFKGSDAALTCSVPGVDYLFLGRYDEPESLKQALGDPPGAGSCVPVADGPEPGRSRYRLGGTVAGTRDCHSLEDDRTSVVEWTNESTRTYGYASANGASGADLARVFAWWERTGRFLTD